MPCKRARHTQTHSIAHTAGHSLLAPLRRRLDHLRHLSNLLRARDRAVRPHYAAILFLSSRVPTYIKNHRNFSG